MTFVLLALMFDGTLTTQYFQDKTSCEKVLEQKIDAGRYKLYDEIDCLSIKHK